LIAAIVTGVIALIVIAILAANYVELEGNLYSQFYKYSSLESQHKSLQSNYDTLLENWVIRVTSIRVGNSDANGRWIIICHGIWVVGVTRNRVFIPPETGG
jgi:hypothetical protein